MINNLMCLSNSEHKIVNKLRQFVHDCLLFKHDVVLFILTYRFFSAIIIIINWGIMCGFKKHGIPVFIFITVFLKKEGACGNFFVKL